MCSLLLKAIISKYENELQQVTSDRPTLVYSHIISRIKFFQKSACHTQAYCHTIITVHTQGIHKNSVSVYSFHCIACLSFERDPTNKHLNTHMGLSINHVIGCNGQRVSQKVTSMENGPLNK